MIVQTLAVVWSSAIAAALVVHASGSSGCTREAPVKAVPAAEEPVASNAPSASAEPASEGDAKPPPVVMGGTKSAGVLGPEPQIKASGNAPAPGASAPNYGQSGTFDPTFMGGSKAGLVFVPNKPQPQPSAADQ
jgi:hypothetical protein